MLTIDGSSGEGGGQIVRTALALSLVTRTPFRMINVRANRKPPGLKRQHLTAVHAAAIIGQGRVTGASVGSSGFTFYPGEVVPGNYDFAIGTAGSTTLVLQTILPPLMRASGPSDVRLEGGTHNIFAPPFDFLDTTFVPLMNRLGVNISLHLQRYGFYPPGGGGFMARILPVSDLRPLELPAEDAVREARARALVVKLPRNIAEREIGVLRERLGYTAEQCTVEVSDRAISPGNVVMVALARSCLTELFTGIGERGVRAETIADRVAGEVERYLLDDAPVGEHLADQLLLPLALAGAGSFVTGPPSSHTTTNIEVIRRFLPVKVNITRIGERKFEVRVSS